MISLARIFPFRIFLTLLLAAGGAISSRAALQEASVTESVNAVSYQASAGAPQKAAKHGTVIHPDNIVRTGVDSRAELQFSDQTVTRMGANSVFSYDATAQRMDLSQGSALFSKPKDGDTFEIATPAATCSISGTTGFLEVLPGKHGQASFVFGLIEGKTNVTIGGKTYPVGSGDLVVSTGQSVHLLKFNISDFMAKAGLVKKFHSTLPNKLEIAKAEERFASLVSRGFIEPTDLSFGNNGNQLALIESFGVQPGQSIRQLGTQIASFEQALQNVPRGGSGFVNVGGMGIIRGQLVWNVDVDLDLHLTLPGNAGTVYYANPTITFNNGAAQAHLDVDDTGQVLSGTTGRVENIIVTGVPANGDYIFTPVDFSGGTATYTLTVTGNNGRTTQVTTGTLTGAGEAGTPSVVVYPPITNRG